VSEQDRNPGERGIRIREATDPDTTITTVDGKHIAEVTLIRAGVSRNGNEYPPEVLREAVPLFEGVRAFADHPKSGDLPERSIRDLVGYYRGVHLDEAGRLRGQLHLVPGNEWLFNLLKEAEGNPALCGLSIDSYGDAKRQGGTNKVNKLLHVASVDIVTRPSAGGQVERILQSDRQPAPDRSVPVGRAGSGPSASVPGSPTQETFMTTEPTTQDSPTIANPVADPRPIVNNTPEGLTALVEAQQKALRESHAELARVRSILNPPSGTGVDLARMVEEIKRERELANAQALLATKLAEAALPEPVAQKLRRQFGSRVFEASELDTAIQDEKGVLAALTSAGQITGMGIPKIEGGMSELDQVQAAFDALFDIYESDQTKNLPRLSGIREAFMVATGVDVAHIGGADRPLREALQAQLRGKVMTGRLLESEQILREADVTTSSFSYLLGTSMNKRMIQDYKAWPSEWQKFTAIVGIKDFKQQDRIRLGAFGSLSTVAEDAAYTTLTLSDEHATYTPTKRGNLVQVTRETIINDDLYAIKQIPSKLAVSAAFTLAEFVYGLLSPNGGNIYDAHKLFDSVNHGNTGIVVANLGTANSGAALSSAALQTAVIAMRKMTNMNGKPIGLKPRFLLVPPDLEFTAMTILKSAGLPGGSNNDINPMMGYAEPIVAPQLNSLSPASTSIWIAVADPRVIDTVEVGFVGGQANPILLIQDMPLYGLNFTQDVISYKVRHEYGGAVTDYRGFYLGNN